MCSSSTNTTTSRTNGNDCFAHESTGNKCGPEKEGTEHTSPAREWAEDEQLQRLLNRKPTEFNVPFVRSRIAMANDTWAEDEELQRLLYRKPLNIVLCLLSAPRHQSANPRDDNNDSANDHIATNALTDGNDCFAHESTVNKCGPGKEGDDNTSPACKRVRLMLVEKNKCGTQNKI